MKNTITIFFWISFSLSYIEPKKEDLEPLVPIINTALNSNQTENQALNYLALGDSYTIGEGIKKRNTWPKLLERYIEKEIGVEINTQIIAETGMTTSDLIRAIELSEILESYELVSLMIGVNNQYRGMNINHFKEEYIQLIDQAIAFTNYSNSRVFVLSIPDWSATPFGQGFQFNKNKMEIEKYNRIIKNICTAKGVDYYNITDISRLVTRESNLIIEDGLHPSKKMYQLWVNEIFPGIIKKLKM